jgi:drug/metabolite transporter (DMT)-like permease
MVPLLFYVGLPSSTAAIYLFFGVIAHTMYMHSLTRAYAIEDFSVAYPFARGLAPLLTILILIFILNKTISLNEIIAIGIIISGIFVLFIGKSFSLDYKNVLALLYFPVSITFYTLVDSYAVKAVENSMQYIVWLFFLMPIPILLYSISNQRNLLITTFTENKFPLIIAAIGSVTSYSLVLWAYTQAPIHYVASIRESSIIFASLIGLLFFKEQGLKRRLAAAVILFIGVFLLEYVS